MRSRLILSYSYICISFWNQWISESVSIQYCITLCTLSVSAPNTHTQWSGELHKGCRGLGWRKGTIMLHLPTYIHCSLSPMVHIQYACISCYFVICWPALADSQLRIHYVDVLKMLRLLTLEPQLTHQMVCCRTTWSCDLTNKSASTSNPWCCARLFFKGSKSNLTIPYRKQNRCLHGKMVTSTDFLSLIYY